MKTENKVAQVLLKPYELNEKFTLKNRVVMAPMTRCMADENQVPTKEMADYYARRADVGLIISEGVIIRADGAWNPRGPGIFNDEQAKAWKQVTDAVHGQGGKIFAQLWHVGRLSHPSFLNGDLPIAPSAVPASGRIPRSQDLEYGIPRTLELEEIPLLVAAYAQAAINARKAGFDGVEIHGANGYLVDQFLHYNTNQRQDKYGGSPKNMARFAIEVVQAIAQEIGIERVGLRLSPGAYHYMEGDPRDTEVFLYLLKQLTPKQLAYLHVGIFDDSMQFENLQGSAGQFLRKNFSEHLIGCGSYTPETAAQGIVNGDFDLIAIGRPLIANPDWIEKIREGKELTSYDASMLKTLE